MLYIVCVNAGNYEGRGKEYVEKLYDGIIRHFPEGVLHKFVCFTDDPEEYNPDIQKRPLHGSLEGWWNKLYLFKEGHFKDGDRIIYFDLDTCIVGELDEIVKYNGSFAILRDVYRPNGLQSSIMMWEAGNYTKSIWQTYSDNIYPIVNGGDQSWIERWAEALEWYEKPYDIIQEKFPDSFVSYKERALLEIPLHASVVFFHAYPRPHQVHEGWVPHIWKIGGHLVRTWRVVGNVTEETLQKNVDHALSLSCELLADQYMFPQDHDLIIAAGGPSLQDNLHFISLLQKYGAKLWALNNSFRYLSEKGIEPDVHILFDAREENIEFVPEKTDALLLYSAQCHPKVLRKAIQAGRLIIWCPSIKNILKILKKHQKLAVIVQGGSSVGMKAIALSQGFGYKKVHLVGYDSSYRDDKHHAYEQNLNDNQNVVDISLEDRKFKSAPWMATQVEEFKHSLPHFLDKGMEFSIYGDGLLPYAAHIMGRK